MSDPARRGACRGYTLVEMLVVLGVLTLLVGLAWPSLRAPWGRTRLEDAGNQLRITLAKTRLKAVESGTAWTFRFEPGTGRFQAAPLARRKPDRSNRSELAEDAPPATETLQGQLPHGVRFVNPEAADEAAALDATLMSEGEGDSPIFAARKSGQSPSPGQSPGHSRSGLDAPLAPPLADDPTAMDETDEWGGRIVFYPNGRCTKAQMRLVGADDRAVDVTLRGLTGMARVGKPWRLESPEGPVKQ